MTRLLALFIRQRALRMNLYSVVQPQLTEMTGDASLSQKLTSVRLQCEYVVMQTASSG